MTPHQQAAHMAVMRIVASLHQDSAMGEYEIVKLVSEAAYEYFDKVQAFAELIEYTEELGLYSDQETPKQE